MRLVRRLSLLAACLVSLVTADPAAAQFTIGGDPRVNPADFRITTFAAGLNYPNGLARLSDGSILVATNNPNGSGMFFVSSGALLRFTDTNDDGIADGPGQVMYSDPVGVWTGLAVTGNMVFVISAKDNANRIIVLKMNNGPASPYTFVGTLNFTFPAGWEHKAYAMTTRPAPGAPAGTWELYFNVGSSANFGQSADTVGLSGLLTGTMQGGSIYRVTVTEVGLGATVSNLVRIAAGLRNAAGMAFHPTTGDLYFEDNGIDGFQDPNEPLSADELNRIAAADLGRQPVRNRLRSAVIPAVREQRHLRRLPRQVQCASVRQRREPARVLGSRYRQVLPLRRELPARSRRPASGHPRFALHRRHGLGRQRRHQRRHRRHLSDQAEDDRHERDVHEPWRGGDGDRRGAGRHEREWRHRHDQLDGAAGRRRHADLLDVRHGLDRVVQLGHVQRCARRAHADPRGAGHRRTHRERQDRKSTRLNSS